jgi:hypothetical protein
MVATVIIVLLILAASFAFALIALIKLLFKQIQIEREKNTMLGYSDIEARNLDLKMEILGTRSRVREAVLTREEEEVVNIDRLRLGRRTWNFAREDWGAVDTLFGYPVEVVEGNHGLIDVVAVEADVPAVVGA